MYNLQVFVLPWYQKWLHEPKKVIEFDVNGDGTIDFDEFLELMMKTSLDMDQTQEIKEAFKIFDRDGNGFIDGKELKQVRRVFNVCVIMQNDLCQIAA